MGKSIFLAVLAVSVIVVAGCHKRQMVTPEPVQPAPAVTEAPPPATEPAEEASVRYADWTGIQQLRPVYFDYDKADLRAQDREIMQGNAEYLKSNPDLMVIVEGHCDERGTVEYNLALGQKRATALREYYGQLGVPAGRIGTISYGSEKPVNAGHAESAWSQNRRAETKVRSSAR